MLNIENKNTSQYPVLIDGRPVEATVPERVRVPSVAEFVYDTEPAQSLGKRAAELVIEFKQRLAPGSDLFVPMHE